MTADIEQSASPVPSGSMRCAAHPQTETYLSCGKCGKPICPACLVQTPVGARCKKCANVRPDLVYHISTPYLLRAIAAGPAWPWAEVSYGRCCEGSLSFPSLPPSVSASLSARGYPGPPTVNGAGGSRSSPASRWWRATLQVRSSGAFSYIICREDSWTTMYFR